MIHRSGAHRGLYGLLFSFLALLLLLTMMVVPPTRPQTHNSIPRAATASPERTVHPMLGIDYTGTYWLVANGKGQRLAPDELEERLQALYETRAERVLFLSASPGTEYSRILDIVDAARAAQVERISLLASCPEGKESLVERCRA